MRRSVVMVGGLVVGLTFASFGAPVSPVGAVAVNRPADPVVLTGAQLPVLVNGPKATIVGFRYTGSAWQQLPVQVDERAVVNFAKIYNFIAPSFYNSQPGLVNAPVYTSGATWTGNDPDPKFDADDEIAFMARDAGVSAASAPAAPVGTVAGTGTEIRVTDPLVPGSESFVYLFRKTGPSGLKQNAGVKYMKYRFKLYSGGYKTTYLLNSGPNPENSLVTGSTYTRHFSDRWLSDGITITAPGASNVDILDRHKALFGPGNCVRSEDTFNAPGPFGPSEGAFVINKTGPVRVIRSYVGANSGPSVQRTHVFYDRMEQTVTNLRVHAIQAIMDLIDLSPAAVGMTYRNSLNQGGVTVDGNPDTLTPGLPTWEQVTGPQGTLTNVAQIETSFTPTVQHYFLDDSTPPVTQCTGDAFAYATSGAWVTGGLPCMDPGLGSGCVDFLRGTRTAYFESPGKTAADAQLLADQVANPLAATTSPWSP